MRFLGLALATLTPSVAYANVVSIAPQKIIDAVGVPKGDGFAGYLSAMYGAGVAGVAVIAVVMIVWGAIQVFGESVWGKTQGKAKIWNAVWGLLLAAGSFVILRTVSESLTQADFALSESLGAEGAGVNIGAPDSNGTPNRPGGNSSGVLDGFTTQSGSEAESIAAAAEYAATHQLNTCSVAGTNGGRRACAYAVNEIVSAATGQPVGGGLSTANMFDALQTSTRFDQVTGGFAASRRGDIVISPTNSNYTGHVGIITQDGGGAIVSNSSNRGSVQQNYTGSSWNSTYANRNGVYIFRPTGSVNTD